MDSLLFTIVCLAVGAVAGFLGGLLGIGGGVIVVPSLILLFDHTGMLREFVGDGNETTLVAVGTSLASIIFTSAAAAVTQTRARMVDWIIVRRFTGMVVLGSYGAGFIAAMLPLATLRALIGSFLAFVSIVMLTNWKPAPHRVLPGPAATVAIAGFAGLVSGVAGIGGGNVVVPTLVYHNVPVHRATATASVLGFPIDNEFHNVNVFHWRTAHAGKPFRDTSEIARHAHDRRRDRSPGRSGVSDGGCGGYAGRDRADAIGMAERGGAGDPVGERGPRGSVRRFRRRTHAAKGHARPADAAQGKIERSWSGQRIRKFLGENLPRVFRGITGSP